jgi:hypothetical protein
MLQRYISNDLVTDDTSRCISHWVEIGNAVLGKQIDDHAYRAYKCSTLANDQKLST